MSMKGKNGGIFDQTGRGRPTKKVGGIMSDGTCVHEGEFVPMKGKMVGFGLKPVGGTPRKRLENHECKNLCP